MVFASLTSNARIIQNMSYAMWNVDTGQMLVGDRTEKIRSIASITKIMTVMVVLNSKLDLQETVVVVGKESSSRIRRGDKITRRELIDLALVASDNLAARTLSETSNMSYKQFIQKMNDFAKELGMTRTVYADSTGLLAANMSTAGDIKTLIESTVDFDVFRENAMRTNTLIHVQHNNRWRTVTANNTNKFAGKMDIIGAKTGFTSAAGLCLTMMFSENGQRYVLVVMGARSGDQRHRMVKKLIDSVQQL